MDEDPATITAQARKVRQAEELDLDEVERYGGEKVHKRLPHFP
jgi:hypothetical protein